ncbi:hypothetical protein FOXG_16446 [Fusarium oxysporum f. sp. lycopersici 4287]|uniref:Uncharacterized protein n=2 Tax=Fusarium oxysporum TaxID=5507 RepID=A0A0J9WVD2_FUSO4|nr:hypothetical protein FOXG_16446 [Fusarium oxysporum f. sp. lycopersici 4287]KNB19327.1 hypothetical protein FOXG_16446 [Fusarium oxysporum f. sp. lycopersici 4287]
MLSASQPHVDVTRGFHSFPSPFPSFSHRHLSSPGFNLNDFKHSASTFIVLFAMGRPGDDDDAEFFAEEFTEVRRMLQGRTVEEFSQLPLVQRKSVFRQHLVQPQRVIIEEGDDGHEMNPAIANGVLLLQQLFMGKDEKGKQMVKEAREVYYGENEFLVRLHWLCEFQCDQYDIDTEPVPIAPLVRRLVVVTNLHDKYDWEDHTEDNPCYPCDGIGDGEGT